MRKRTHSGGGFLICLVVNMVLNWELGLLALVLFVARIWFPVIPIWVPLGVLGLWFFIPFFITLVLSVLSGLANSESEPAVVERKGVQDDKHKESMQQLEAFRAKKQLEKERRNS